MPPALSTFAIAADELRRQELAHLADTLTPRIEALRLMTPSAFRAVIALMMERLGHTIITDPSAPDLVTTKAERKFIIACARPTDLAPTGTLDLARLHDAVIATNAQRGIYVTARTFTAQAEQFSKTASIDLVNGARLIKGLDHSLSGVLLPPIYKAMCRQCGAIV